MLSNIYLHHVVDTWFETMIKTRMRDGTSDFLGFTHFWGKSQKGKRVIKRKTASKRLKSKLQAIAEWCRDNRHRPIREQDRTLCIKLQGHCQYYGVIGDYY